MNALEVLVTIAADFVSYLPISHTVGLRVAVLCALCPPRSSGLAVAVLDQVSGALRAVGEAEANQWLGIHQLAKLAKFVNANIVGIQPSPDFIWKGRASMAVANPIFPAIFSGIANAAAPADKAGMGFLNCRDDIRPPPVEVVGRH